MLAAVLFDLDGTLLASNGLHVEAWDRALAALGYRVAADRIGVEVGKGGDQLVPSLLGTEAEARDGDALREAHDAAYRALAEQRGLAPMRGARELVAAIRGRGLRVALATSSSSDMLAVCERASGVPWRELFDVVTSADDARRSKPAPDIVAAAVSRLGVSPAECAMLGDTPWDAHAARGAGVTLVGVRCGGNRADALRRAGARLVRDDPAHVLATLDDVLHRVSPSSIRVDAGTLDALVQHALDAASEGMAGGEAPIGCVLARGDGEVIARAWNAENRTGDRAAHAEIEAFRAAAGKIARDARDTILVSTLEPCVMCLGAAMETAVDTVVFALRAPEDCGTNRVTPPEGADNQMPRIVGEIRAADSRELFEAWLSRADRNRTQEPFIRALLARTTDAR